MVSGKPELLIASNCGPLTIVRTSDGEDDISRGSGGLVSGMQHALADSPDAVWVCAAMNDRERALARRAPRGRLSQIDIAASALDGEFDVRMLPIDAGTFRIAYD